VLRLVPQRLSFSWRVDETYTRVKGCWKYLYRAIDKDGATRDFYLADWTPRVISTDTNPAYGEAIAALKKEGVIPQQLVFTARFLNYLVINITGKGLYPASARARARARGRGARRALGRVRQGLPLLRPALGDQVVAAGLEAAGEGGKRGITEGPYPPREPIDNPSLAQAAGEGREFPGERLAVCLVIG
jgi:hypothetical protein